MATPIDMFITKGATFGPWQVIFKDEDDNPFPLAGYYAEAQAGKCACGDAVIDFLPTIEADDAEGIVTLSVLSSTVTATLPSGAIKWDMFLITPTGDRLFAQVFGTVQIVEANTQP